MTTTVLLPSGVVQTSSSVLVADGVMQIEAAAATPASAFLIASSIFVFVFRSMFGRERL